ncbi:MAG: hypothetical protein LUD69_07985 [Oscillospiraceae bacterium]|nr:hypothetical protein [Oscillospiraceae bacterium]
MYAYDFEYDGVTLSDLGYTLCKFDSSGEETVTNGSQITFNTVSTLRGAKYELTSSEYSECITTTFQMCKDLCAFDDLEISVSEMRELMSWLNRKRFHKFKLLDENNEYSSFYFEGSFNISRIEMDDKVVGLELTLITNRPFALLEPVTVTISTSGSFEDVSDEEGFIYPETTITLKASGNLTIYNVEEDRTTYIANCTSGEVITMNYPVISSSLSSHEIQNDFNWNFLRVANTYEEHTNTISSSLSCTIVMTYSPVVKIGL